MPQKTSQKKATKKKRTLPASLSPSSKKKKKTLIRNYSKKKCTVGSKRQVWNGTCKKTKGGLTKSDLQFNEKTGRIISKTKSDKGKKNLWSIAVKKARKRLDLEGFVPIGGSTAQGQDLYNMAHNFYRQMKK